MHPFQFCAFHSISNPNLTRTQEIHFVTNAHIPSIFSHLFFSTSSSSTFSCSLMEPSFFLSHSIPYFIIHVQVHTRENKTKQIFNVITDCAQNEGKAHDCGEAKMHISKMNETLYLSIWGRICLGCAKTKFAKELRIFFFFLKRKKAAKFEGCEVVERATKVHSSCW